MKTENSLASETASDMQYINRASRLRTEQQMTNQHVLVVTGGASGANPRTSTTRRAGSSQTPGNASNGMMNTFIMRSYYIHTENEKNVAMYRQKTHQAFIAQYPNIRVTEQRIADQRRAIIQRKLLFDITIRRIQQEALNLSNSNENNKAENIKTIQMPP
jgi:hypothetical protein